MGARASRPRNDPDRELDTMSSGLRTLDAVLAGMTPSARCTTMDNVEVTSYLRVLAQPHACVLNVGLYFDTFAKEVRALGGGGDIGDSTEILRLDEMRDLFRAMIDECETARPGTRRNLALIPIFSGSIPPRPGHPPHVMMLLVDRATRAVERFDPNGESVDGPAIDMTLTEIFPGYSVAAPKDNACINIPGLRGRDCPGACALLSLMYAELRVMNPAWLPDAVRRYVYSLPDLGDVVRRYQTYIESVSPEVLRAQDSALDSCHLRVATLSAQVEELLEARAPERQGIGRQETSRGRLLTREEVQGQRAGTAETTDGRGTYQSRVRARSRSREPAKATRERERERAGDMTARTRARR
jgi:hypothetical protein